MKRIVILGAGQMGRSAAALVNRNGYDIAAFGDNAADGSAELCGVRVTKVAEALSAQPDAVLIAVAGKTRASELAAQAWELGYTGRLFELGELMEAVDIRTATAVRIFERIRNVAGAAAELGVYKGDTARVINAENPERTLYLFDTFEGFDARDITTESEKGFSRAKEADFSDTGAERVLARMPHPERVIIKKGYFPETCEGVDDTFAFVSLDADLYEPTSAGLEWFLPRMAEGGMLLLHDFNNTRFSGVRQAVEDYEKRHGRLCIVPLCDLHGSAVIVKDGVSKGARGE